MVPFLQLIRALSLLILQSGSRPLAHKILKIADKIDEFGQRAHRIRAKVNRGSGRVVVSTYPCATRCQFHAYFCPIANPRQDCGAINQECKRSYTAVFSKSPERILPDNNGITRQLHPNHKVTGQPKVAEPEINIKRLMPLVR